MDFKKKTNLFFLGVGVAILAVAVFSGLSVNADGNTVNSATCAQVVNCIPGSCIKSVHFEYDPPWVMYICCTSPGPSTWYTCQAVLGGPSCCCQFETITPLPSPCYACHNTNLLDCVYLCEDGLIGSLGTYFPCVTWTPYCEYIPEPCCDD